MKATVTAHRDTLHGTYISLSFPCLPHVKWNDPTTLVRAGGTCVDTTNADLHLAVSDPSSAVSSICRKHSASVSDLHT